MTDWGAVDNMWSTHTADTINVLGTLDVNDDTCIRIFGC